STLSELDDFAAACLGGNESRVRSLLATRPDLIDQLGIHRAQLLQLAAEGDKRDAIRLMVKLGFDVNEVSRTAALHNAAMCGHLEMVKLLIELGANPLIRDTEFNAYPRGWAEFNGKMEVVEYLKRFEG